MADPARGGVPDLGYWRSYFKYYDSLNHLIPYGELLQGVADAVAPLEGMCVLDAGSGSGNLSVRMAQMGGRVVALDNVRQALELHREKDGNALVILADLLSALPFGDGVFDALVANNVVWAIPPDRRPAVLQEFGRVLKPGARLAVATVHKDFSPVRIYLDHCRREAQRDGWPATLLHLLRMVYPTIRMLHCNATSVRRGYVSLGAMIDAPEQRALLAGAGFTVTSEARVYAGQSVLHAAVNAPFESWVGMRVGEDQAAGV